MISLLKKIRLTDYKTDIFLAANILDAVFTHIALEQGGHLTEFNSIVYGLMSTIGIGAALFLKVVLAIVIVWVLRKTRRDYLLVPLSVILVTVALANLTVARTNGIDI